jgi:arsenate reductase
MKKVYHLSNCGTCKKIITENRLAEKGFILQDIKADRIEPAELDEMRKLAGSYAALFSKKAIKYKTLGLKDKQLSEEEYRNYILEEYTFLKRPVILAGDRIFAGSDKKTVEDLSSTL